MKAEKILLYLEQQDYTGLQKAAAEELKQEEARKTYGASAPKRIKAIQRFLSEWKEVRPGIGKINHQTYRDKQAVTFCSGYSGFILYDFLETFPKEDGALDFVSLAERLNTAKELTDFDPAAAMAFYREVRAKKEKDKYSNYPYQIGTKFVNSSYLKEVLDILGSKGLQVYTDSTRLESPVKFENANGTAILMPLRHNGKGVI